MQGSNRILTWLTANPPGFGHKTHQTGGFEGGDKLRAQLVGFEQATTKNALNRQIYLIINQDLVEKKQKRWTGRYEDSGGAVLVTT